MKIDFKRILFLGPHGDDDTGCSGTLMRFLEEGKDVFYVVFSFCEESAPEGYDKDYSKSEIDAAMKVLEINPQNIYKFNFKCRHFNEDRQEILEQLITLKDLINPDLVLLPSSSDIHQDHCVIRKEGIRAFRYASILGYESLLNVIASKHACYVEIKRKHLNKKHKMITCFKSQYSRSYWGSNFVESLAIVRGSQASNGYAEMFEVLKLQL